ncbi:3-deoxy-D-manno-octulosonic acid transferase [Hippea maritima]|uniref:3-deoxy-D-manno-octulosonic acid transferase n=1 Tax=Hippea maritima (strain ATCC 700847 / DSM 10411 / MH2) TaxID=760142 RepID=F2LXE4_HIPMA|nr:glycosyltransferase N-terminal domain-containing protein [Hippea maritima]AEA34258.1 Three-deoxy-D-manno-octulosonic-acid transferase domain-containing protein [Hippea maritima DSM 10411]
MLILYNLLILFLSIAAAPLILIKSITDKRLRYRIKDRFLPKSINEKDYILFHASSFGETKTLFSVKEFFEKELNSKVVFSVFTDTAHKLLNENGILSPIDFYPLYAKIFKHPPKIALFFETEIWPSYLSFLKKRNTKLVLINARMSNSTYKTYKRFGFFFKRIISVFDLIIAKSHEDAKRFKYFNTNTIVCGNLKQYKKPQKFNPDNLKKTFLIQSTKPVLTLASFHKEEIDIAIEIIDKLRNDFFIVLAPRHLEDVPLFEKQLQLNQIPFSNRTSKKQPSTVLLLDTMGELEGIYSFTDVCIVGGSFHENLKGHNPIEPLFYNNVVICGPFMESFSEEVEQLKKLNMINQLKDTKSKDLIESIKKSKKVDSSDYFKHLEYILNCYLINTKNLLKHN